MLQSFKRGGHVAKVFSHRMLQSTWVEGSYKAFPQHSIGMIALEMMDNRFSLMRQRWERDIPFPGRGVCVTSLAEIENITIAFTERGLGRLQAHRLVKGYTCSFCLFFSLFFFFFFFFFGGGGGGTWGHTFQRLTVKYLTYVHALFAQISSQRR